MWCWSGDNGSSQQQTGRGLDMAAQRTGQLDWLRCNRPHWLLGLESRGRVVIESRDSCYLT